MADSTNQQVINNYQLGDCLGKGAFGSVYRALNWETGEAVAVKKIKLSNIPKSDLNFIMTEIDLLKNLNHPNIVKYKGFVKTKEFLFIILEYCENGSLHNICKKFGKFPENLVAVYISQVLEGLLYLHEQGVIHRDIKGANILTTKEGLVKLADFGVATKTTTLGDFGVVGSPYWMAPEIIELSGATTSSDIWSVGCVVIELLEGKPPYHHLDPMPALFRIVQDEHPPLPESASPAVKDFLMQCFHKDSNLRVSARKLLKHPWIANTRKNNVVIINPNNTGGNGSNINASGGSSGNNNNDSNSGGGGDVNQNDDANSNINNKENINDNNNIINNNINNNKNNNNNNSNNNNDNNNNDNNNNNNVPRPVISTEYEETIKSVQEWNKALKASKSSIKLPPAFHRRRKSEQIKLSLPSTSSPLPSPKSEFPQRSSTDPSSSSSTNFAPSSSSPLQPPSTSSPVSPLSASDNANRKKSIDQVSIVDNNWDNFVDLGSKNLTVVSTNNAQNNRLSMVDLQPDSEDDNWDDDFADSITITKIAAHQNKQLNNKKAKKKIISMAMMIPKCQVLKNIRKVKNLWNHLKSVAKLILIIPIDLLTILSIIIIKTRILEF